MPPAQKAVKQKYQMWSRPNILFQTLEISSSSHLYMLEIHMEVDCSQTNNNE